jgi:hypothetical protein
VTKEATISLSQRFTVRGLRIVVLIGAAVYLCISYRRCKICVSGTGGCNICLSATGAVIFEYQLQELYDLCISYRGCKICVSTTEAVRFVYQLQRL